MEYDDFKQENYWCIFDLNIGQISQVEGNHGKYDEFRDGFMCTSGTELILRCRKLTLKNKVILQSIKSSYENLRKIDGERGFNYPRIHSYFSHLVCEAIDESDDKKVNDYIQKAYDFVNSAKSYEAIIQGIPLFRSAA